MKYNNNTALQEQYKRNSLSKNRNGNSRWKKKADVQEALMTVNVIIQLWCIELIPKPNAHVGEADSSWT